MEAEEIQSPGLIEVLDNTIFVNLDQEITGPENYRSIYTMLYKATENDTVIFRLNSSGGDVNSTIQILNSIYDTKAKTVSEIYLAYSSASMIALACSEIRVKKYASMMIHSLRYDDVSGKVGEILTASAFVREWSREFMDDIYRGFLTEDELNQISTGADLYFTEYEIINRLSG